VAESIAYVRDDARDADCDMGSYRNVADLLPAATFDSRVDFDQWLGNTIAVPATFNVTGPDQTYLGESGTGPNGLVFSAQAGSPSQTQTIGVDPAGFFHLGMVRINPWIERGCAATGGAASQRLSYCKSGGWGCVLRPRDDRRGGPRFP